MVQPRCGSSIRIAHRFSCGQEIFCTCRLDRSALCTAHLTHPLVKNVLIFVGDRNDLVAPSAAHGLGDGSQLAACHRRDTGVLITFAPDVHQPITCSPLDPKSPDLGWSGTIMTACSRTLLSHLDPVAVGKQRNGPMNGFTSMTWARLIEHVARVDAKQRPPYEVLAATPRLQRVPLALAADRGSIQTSLPLFACSLLSSPLRSLTQQQ